MKNLKKLFSRDKENLIKLLGSLNQKTFPNFSKNCNKVLFSIKNKKKILIFGNGGSAADAQHIAAELVVRFKKNRKALPAIALTTDPSIITATSNDINFNVIFTRQIEALASKGDICIGLTTSGNSKNVLDAVKFMKKKGIKFFIISGNNGGKLKKITKNLVLVPSKDTAMIQTIQLFLGHIMCEYIENSITN